MVRLKLDVSAAGAVVRAWVLASDSSELEPVACAYVRGLSFRPATKGGSPVATSVEYTFESTAGE
jgi:outer membrane biosynthesis protein TonB